LSSRYARVKQDERKVAWPLDLKARYTNLSHEHSYH
jgi:hypothetical protein